MSKHIRGLQLTVLLGVLGLAPALAAQAADPEEAARPPAAERGDDAVEAGPQTDADEASADDATGRTSEDVFNPSEEISEDFAVSFPVDI